MVVLKALGRTSEVLRSLLGALGRLLGAIWEALGGHWSYFGDILEFGEPF